MERQSFVHDESQQALDGAEYFSDKQDLYLKIKTWISFEFKIPISSARICGSAYWGKSFIGDRDFEPGKSDLDVALISPEMFVRCLSETRAITKGFTDMTVFPTVSYLGGILPNVVFEQYAFRKGIIRVDLLPNTATKREIDRISRNISKSYLAHFKRISFGIYDCENSFAVKQRNATEKFRNNENA